MSDTAFFHLLDVAAGYEPCCDDGLCGCMNITDDGDDCQHLDMDEMTGYPTDPSGRCVVYNVCHVCSFEVVVGSDSVL